MISPPSDIGYTIGLAILGIGIVIGLLVPFIQYWVARDHFPASPDRVPTLGDQVNDELWDHLDRTYWHEQVDGDVESISETSSENPSEA
jgi:hypothetical protein